MCDRSGILGNVCMPTRHLPPRGVGWKQVMLAKNDNGFYTLNSREKYLRFTHELNPFEMISKTINFYHFFFENRQKLKIFGIFYQNVYISKWARGRDFNDKIVIKIKI